MGSIDYDRAAGAYRAGRTLAPEVLERWRRAISPAMSGLRHPTVLDVGCGTGQFCEPIARWFDARVIGVEPSSGMLGEALREPPGRGVAYLSGRCEALPIRHATVDRAWLSAVVHQISDLPKAVQGLGRTLRPGGAVLVRGFFGDMAPPGLFAHLPGIERAVATFPITARVVDAFRQGGFDLSWSDDVAEPHQFTGPEWVDRARRLRSTDSLMRPLTDEEVEAGLETIRGAKGIQPEVRLRLLVFTLA